MFDPERTVVILLEVDPDSKPLIPEKVQRRLGRALYGIEYRTLYPRRDTSPTGLSRGRSAEGLRKCLRVWVDNTPAAALPALKLLWRMAQMMRRVSHGEG